MPRILIVMLGFFAANGASTFAQVPSPAEAPLDSRLQKNENIVYEYRDPTPAEVTAMEDDWRAKNPFKFSANMPDFSKQKIKARKPDRERAESIARTQELTDRIAALEQQLAQKQATAKTAAPVSSRPAEKPVTAPPKTDKTVQSPREPNPSNVVLRKIADGRVVAIIGGKTLTFASEKEALAHIARLKP